MSTTRPKLLPSKQCEDRIQAGADLTGYFLDERLHVLGACIADLEIICAKLKTPNDAIRLQRLLQPLSEAMGNLELHVLRVGDEG